MLDYMLDEAARLSQPVTVGEGRQQDKNYVIRQITEFLSSPIRKAMLDGEKYYAGRHDILDRKRTVIGEDGELVEVKNLPNNRIVDNQYKKMVDQKVNYLIGQPISVHSDNKQYAKALKRVFNKRFQCLLKGVGEDSLNCGIGWMYVGLDENGELVFRRMHPYELIPSWANSEHTKLDYVIRIYEIIKYENKTEKIVRKVEIYDENGINFFEMQGSGLTPVKPYHQPYIMQVDDSGAMMDGWGWSRIPLVPFKYNAKEIPLIKMVKSLQDGLNLIESNFQNSMEEDARNTILVVMNYDGEDLGEFRRNLAQFGAVKVSTIDGAGGDIKTLQVEVDSENYKAVLELFKKAIIENAMGYDAKDDRLNGNPNQMNIQSMYSDIDLDANNMETEYQASMEELLWFIDNYLADTGKGNFEGEDVDIIFNRDMLISEGEVIDNCIKSLGILSDETVIAMHPWVDDPAAELERLKRQREENVEQYGMAFNRGSDREDASEDREGSSEEDEEGSKDGKPDEEEGKK